MQPSKNAPSRPSKHRWPQSYRVWANCPYYQEDAKPWKCMAAFVYLQECLDYIAYCQDRGHDVVFQSPADVRLIKATDRRVVYKPEGSAA